MKRDMELVRRILIDLADSRHPLNASIFVTDRVSFEDVCYHYRIMSEGGLIKASVSYADNEPYIAIASELTWDGNEFLAAVKSDTVWAKVKTRIAKATGDTTLDVMKALAVKIGGDIILAGL
ncbi:MAG: DUF2513 domain-containing protein [Raoultibacter sp.]